MCVCVRERERERERACVPRAPRFVRAIDCERRELYVLRMFVPSLFEPVCLGVSTVVMWFVVVSR